LLSKIAENIFRGIKKKNAGSIKLRKEGNFLDYNPKIKSDTANKHPMNGAS
jgi:hypothetical protein